MSDTAFLRIRCSQIWLCCQRTLVAGLLLATARVQGATFLTGIDVSHWQGTINWTLVKKAGIEFAFMKATEDTNKTDPTFAKNIKDATAAGILVGPYHFCRLDTNSDSPQDAIDEANFFLSKIKPYYQSGAYLPPVADVERFPKFSTTAKAKSFTSKWVTKFSDTIYKSLGVRPLLYNSKSKVNTYYTSAVAAANPLWVAWWRKTGAASPPTSSDVSPWSDWTFWQYADKAHVSGISGRVDHDVFNGTKAQLNALRVGIVRHPRAETGDRTAR